MTLRRGEGAMLLPFKTHLHAAPRGPSLARCRWLPSAAGSDPIGLCVRCAIFSFIRSDLSRRIRTVLVDEGRSWYAV